jgi:hypothetical protein
MVEHTITIALLRQIHTFRWPFRPVPLVATRGHARVARPIQALPKEPQDQCDPEYMPNLFLHVCNLYFYCLPQPLPSLSFSVHISHSNTLSCPVSHFPPRFPYAFLALVRLPLRSFWRLEFRWNRLILYFPKSPKAIQSDILYFLLHVVHHPKTHQEHLRTTESTQYPNCIRLTSAHFAKCSIDMQLHDLKTDKDRSYK